MKRFIVLLLICICLISISFAQIPEKNLNLPTNTQIDSVKNPSKIQLVYESALATTLVAPVAYNVLSSHRDSWTLSGALIGTGWHSLKLFLGIEDIIYHITGKKKITQPHLFKKTGMVLLRGIAISIYTKNTLKNEWDERGNNPNSIRIISAVTLFEWFYIINSNYKNKVNQS